MKMRINLKNGNHWPKLNKFSFHGSDKKNFIWHRDIASSQLKWSEKMRFLQKNHLHWNGLDWNVCSRHTSKKNPAILPVWNEWKCRHAKKKIIQRQEHICFIFFLFLFYSSSSFVVDEQLQQQPNSIIIKSAIYMYSCVSSTKT